MTNVKASYLVEKFNLMVWEHWTYVANAAQKGKVDCSGAFTYWYRQVGASMYHGSNTMYRKWSVLKGKIGQIELVPGMAVYKNRNDGKEPLDYVGDGIGNMYHVGLYIGGGKVVQAKGTKYGVVISDISEWHYCSRLKYTDYDLSESEDQADETDAQFPCEGVIKLSSGYLNLRCGASTTFESKEKANNGDIVTVLGKQGDWLKVIYNNKTLYAKASFVVLMNHLRRFVISVEADSEQEKEKLVRLLKQAGFAPTIIEERD